MWQICLFNPFFRSLDRYSNHLLISGQSVQAIINIPIWYFMIHGIEHLYWYSAIPHVMELKVQPCSQSSDTFHLLVLVKSWWVVGWVTVWCISSGEREMDPEKGSRRSRGMSTLEKSLIFLFVAMTGACVGLVAIYFTEKANASTLVEGEFFKANISYM